MPIIWIGFSTASSPEIHALRNQPVRLREYVEWLIANTNTEPPATLEDLYFEVGSDRACAVVKDLDDYVAVKVVTRKLGADYVRKFLTPEQAADAIEQLRNLPGNAPAPDDEPGADAV